MKRIKKQIIEEVTFIQLNLKGKTYEFEIFSLIRDIMGLVGWVFIIALLISLFIG